MAPRFTTRTLLAVVAISAICAWILRTSDWVAAVGFGPSAFLLSTAREVCYRTGGAVLLDAVQAVQVVVEVLFQNSAVPMTNALRSVRLLATNWEMG